MEHLEKLPDLESVNVIHSKYGNRRIDNGCPCCNRMARKGKRHVKRRKHSLRDHKD